MSIETIQPSARRWSLQYGLVRALLIIAVLVAYWFWSDRQNRARETAAARELRQLGAIAGMDGNRRHVATINLSPLQSREKLARALELLPDLAHVTSLDASRTPIRDQQLETIAGLSSLKSLSLNSTDISDQGVEQLKPLSNLQTIYLVSTKITDRSVTALESLHQLRIVDLSATKVTANLEPLTQLPQLEWLLLRNLTLADDALVQLRDCSSLRRLSLQDSTYSAESLTTLQRVSPQIGVDR